MVQNAPNIIWVVGTNKFKWWKELLRMNINKMKKKIWNWLYVKWKKKVWNWLYVKYIAILLSSSNVHHNFWYKEPKIQIV